MDFVDRRFRECMDLVFEAEGIGSDDPLDRGGLTRFGISQRAHSEVDLAALDKDGAEAIYALSYYSPLKIAQFVFAPTAMSLFLFGVNTGVREAGKRLQFALNGIGKPLAADGIIGPATVSAANSVRPILLFDRFQEEQREFYRSLVEKDPSQRKWLKGWYNRIGRVRA